MNCLRCILLLQFATILALGQSARDSKPTSLPNQPEALVRSLYTEVIARHPPTRYLDRGGQEGFRDLSQQGTAS